MGRKTCTNCGDSFNPPKNNEYVKRCGPCHYEHYRLFRIAQRYGITEDQYIGMYAAQGGRCRICNTHESELNKRLSVDHDHSCCPGRNACGKCVRSLLCHKCNTSIAHFEADPNRLLIAHEYLTGGE